MKYDFVTCPDRSASDSSKWAKYAGRDIIPAWVADADFKSAPEILDALRRRVDHGVFGYPSHPPKSTMAAILEYLETRQGWKNVDPEWIVFTPTLVGGLHASIRSTSAPGESIMTHIPVYPPFLGAPATSERVARKVPMAWAADRKRWEMDPTDLEAATPADARLFMLCNPFNPLGRVFDQGELESIAAYAEKHDMTVCADEIHCDLILDETKKHLPFAHLAPEVADRTITLYSASKTYNLPGLYCGYAVIPNAKRRAAYRRVIQGLCHEIGVFGYLGLESAYNFGEPWRQELLQVLRGNLDLLCDTMATTPGVSYSMRNEATYLAWIDVRELGFDNPQTAFEAGGVGFNNGADFGLPGHIRINMACPRERMIEILRRFRAVAEARMATK